MMKMKNYDAEEESNFKQIFDFMLDRFLNLF